MPAGSRSAPVRSVSQRPRVTGAARGRHRALTAARTPVSPAEAQPVAPSPHSSGDPYPSRDRSARKGAPVGGLGEAGSGTNGYTMLRAPIRTASHGFSRITQIRFRYDHDCTGSAAGGRPTTLTLQSVALTAWSNQTVSSFNPTCNSVFQENRFAGKSVKSVAVFGFVGLSNSRCRAGPLPPLHAAPHPPAPYALT